MTTGLASPDRAVVAQHLREAYMEIFPAPGIAAKLAALERGAYVAVTCSPARGPEATLALSRELVEAGFRVVPHVAARSVRDRQHLREIMSTIEALGIESLFVPGGDRAEPVGRYRTALELLRDISDIGHRLRYVGVAAHPEGHPLADEATLLAELERKQEHANYLVTQLCFDAPALGDWLARVRERGITLPAWIGLPGVIERAQLLRTSLRIGVGDSLRFLKRQARSAARLMSAAVYRPDALLESLAPIAANPAYGVAGYHLFCFNQIEATESWRREMLGVLE